jgi:glycosyltransferase involved in cell wall biosynthesis
MISIKKGIKQLQWSLVRLMKRRKVLMVTGARGTGGDEYKGEPRVTAVLQFFNKRENIPMLWQMLTNPMIDEVVICEDGSSDGSVSEWIRLATGKNHFVVRSNDLFEVRTYDRAIRFARGEYVLLLQDDEIPLEESGNWVERGLRVFAQDPKLALLGGRKGSEIRADHAGNLYETGIHDAADENLSWTYAMIVNRGPWMLKRSATLELGGIDQTFAPFQFDDFDLCMRLWLAGFRVGLFDARFRRDVGVGGMRLFNSKLIDGQTNPNWEKAKRNWKLIEKRYRGRIEDVRASVEAARRLRSGNGGLE